MNNRNKILRIAKRIIQLLMIIQIIIGVIFIIKNINYMPAYGDSKEFLEISQTMELDSFRPFIYPIMLKATTSISNLFGVSITSVTYTIQIIISLFASFILIKTIKKIFNIKTSKKEMVLYALFILFIPFNIHSSMSIKCDSLATSFTILFLCSLVYYLKEQKIHYAIYSLLTMFITSNIRSEKIYFLSFILVCFIIFEIIKTLKIQREKIIKNRKIIILTIILIIGIISTNIAKIIFQRENTNNRSQPTISMYLYERIVGNTLSEIYQYLPKEVKQDISYEEALETQNDRNKYKLPYEKLYAKDGNLDRVKQIIKTAIRRNFPDIISNTISDFEKNIVTPYYLEINQEDWSKNYTLTKMRGEHYLYTDGYILYFETLFIIINIYLVLGFTFNKNKIKNIDIQGIIVLALYIIVSAGFFATLTSQNFHIKYAMPTYIIEITIITVLINVFQERKKDGRANRYIDGNI